MAELCNKPNIIAVVGPTASGKTKLGVELAKKYNGEVVSADSMQIYKGMHIATAKPDEEEMQGIPHHLIGVIEPSELFNVAEYKKMANEAIEKILSKGKLPIIVGGTGLYIDSVLQGVEFGDFEVDQVRKTELENIAKTVDGQELLDILKKYDEKLANDLHPNDTSRIIRGILVFEATGKTLTQHKIESKLGDIPFSSCTIGLGCNDREYLYNRIDRRVDIMLEMGLEQETKEFFESEVSKTAKAAIGYKELYPYLFGKESKKVSVERLKRETRRYAKRQLTWFRKNEDINWINIDQYDFKNIIKRACKIIDLHLNK